MNIILNIHYSYALLPTMSTHAEKPAETDTASQILDAAEERFRTYGYNKTTMAEIATDVGMSTANLYRYFRNKLEIAADCAKNCLNKRAELLKAVVDQQNVSAADKLEQFFLAIARHTYTEAKDNIKINELIAHIITERQDIVKLKNQHELAYIAEILAQGNTQGEFDVNDVIATAEVVHVSLALFQTPLFMGLYDLETFESLATRSARLLICGLKQHS
ncbi:MAG TPA: TetR/AcrR family transcriptional regulator [Gammaproteobacteria bacterium]|nr:TetR/AcrR family transcriptional regulator [Gammaproteobacteria bacterium]